MVDDVKTKTGINDVITIDCTGCDINYGNGILYKDGGPYEWVYLLSHAALICMDSFHATVFALKFHKDFVHILKTKSDNSTDSQNTRMYDMFSRYDIGYKLYNASSHDWLRPINYNKVDAILKEEISRSMDYLKIGISN